MFRPCRFEIEFDVPQQVYFSDQIVSGAVILEITDPLNLKGIKLRFKGECAIHFSETKKIIKKAKGKKKKKQKDIQSKIDETVKEMMEYKKKLPPINTYCVSNGVQNPGYIPEEEGALDLKKQDLSREFNGVPLDSYMKDHRPRYRPTSSESVWGGSITKGPRQHFQAVETYFDCEFYIYGHKYQKAEKESLPSGVHKFPFAFNLPPNLPPSFSSEKGIIRYIVAAVLDRPAAANLVRKTGFTVLAFHDLNLISDATSSVSGSKSVNRCGLCCDTGPITMSLHIPRKGYVPGEAICVCAEIDNISGRHTTGTKLTLLQVITYTMPNDLKTHQVERILRQVVRGTLAPGESDFWEDVTISIPPVGASNMHTNCRLMGVDYKLEMIVGLPRVWKDLKVTLPIIIGNIPLRTTFPSFLPPNETNEQQIILPGIKYPDFPPFNFGQCFYGEEILEKQYENLTMDAEYMGPPYVPETPYAPKYMVYTPGNNVSRTTSSSFDFESSSVMS